MNDQEIEDRFREHSTRISVAERLADHHARIITLEAGYLKLSAKLDKLIWGVMATLVGVVVQILMKAKF